MAIIVSILFFIFFLLRLLTMIISARNEKKLRKLNAVEFGKSNSTWLVIAHMLYYAAVMTEGFMKGAFFTDRVSYAGLTLYIFSIVALYYVIYSIRHIWTVKLIIAPNDYHVINSNFLFKYIRHPNYFLNIIPELVGIALLFHAWSHWQWDCRSISFH